MSSPMTAPTTRGWSAGSPNVAPRRSVARSFFQTHSDSYDFLVVFPTFAADFGREVGGLHSGVRNEVDGLGLPRFDFGATYGSASRLKGYIDVAALMPGRPPPSVQDAVAIVAHEVAHQWAARVSFKDSATGQASQAQWPQSPRRW